MVDEEPAGGKLESPLGCSCRDSRKADIIPLIAPSRLEAKQQNPRGGFFSAQLGQRCSSRAQKIQASETSRQCKLHKRIYQIFKSKIPAVTCALIVTHWQILHNQPPVA